LLFFTQIRDYEYLKGKPSSKGVSNYIKRNEYELIEEFKKYVDDTILDYYDVYIETDNLSLYTGHDTLELGRFYIPNDIIITNEELFLDYELVLLPKWRKKQHLETNQFVKSTVMHELTHWYFYSVMQVMRHEKRNVEPGYLSNFRMMPYTYGAEFIEEGVCEYVSADMGQMMTSDKEWKPEDVKEILDGKDGYAIKYRYSLQYVKAVLDTMELRKGIELLLRNKPPSNEEILHPETFYNRLK
jgi:hypothetical protein